MNLKLSNTSFFLLLYAILLKSNSHPKTAQKIWDAIKTIRKSQFDTLASKYSE